MDRPILVTEHRASGKTQIVMTYSPADMAEMFSPDEREMLAKGWQVVREGQWPHRTGFVDLLAHYNAQYYATPTTLAA